MPAGRPSEYRIEFSETAHKLAQQGATDREIAEALDIAESTLYLWRHTHPEFLEALRLGKEAADDRVESALYHRAVGYRHDAIKIMQHNGEVIVEPYVEHVPPDIGAIKMWLMNRRGETWREKQTTEHTGPGGGSIGITTSGTIDHRVLPATAEFLGALLRAGADTPSAQPDADGPVLPAPVRAEAGGS